MPTCNVPDHVIFGPRDGVGTDLTYGEIRAVGTQEQVEALRRRFEKWLIEQTRPIFESGVSPFPLAVMTCVGIEAVGQVAFGEGADQNHAFVSVADLIDVRFSNRLSTSLEGSARREVG